MRFSIECENGGKEIFASFREASEKTGISIASIWNCLKKNPEGRWFIRRSDKKEFFVKEERDERLVVIDGEDFYSDSEITRKFGISYTVFFNQLVRKKNNFLDAGEISHKVDWVCDELKRVVDTQRFVNMTNKKGKGRKRIITFYR